MQSSTLINVNDMKCNSHEKHAEDLILQLCLNLVFEYPFFGVQFKKKFYYTNSKIESRLSGIQIRFDCDLFALIIDWNGIRKWTDTTVF